MTSHRVFHLISVGKLLRHSAKVSLAFSDYTVKAYQNLN